MPQATTPAPVYTVPEFLEAHRISRTFFYSEVGAGRLRLMKAGRRTLITQEAAAEWRALCEQRTVGEVA